MLDGRPPAISNSEKDLTGKEKSTFAQLRSGYCGLLGSYKIRIKQDASLNVCADCFMASHDGKHLFVCPARPTTMTPYQLRSGYCGLLGSYKSRIKQDARLNVCAVCFMASHDGKHLFLCPARPTTMPPSDLWSRPAVAVQKLSYLEHEMNMD